MTAVIFLAKYIPVPVGKDLKVSQAYSCEGPETSNEELWEGKGLPRILGIGIHDVLFWFPTRWNVLEEHVR